MVAATTNGRVKARRIGTWTRPTLHRRPGVWLLAAVVLLGWVAPVRADRATAKQLFEQGRAAELAGDHDKALALYQSAIGEDTDYVPAYERAVPLWMQRGAFAVAIRALERFSLRHPKRAFAWYALAYAYRRTGQPEFAALSYESYIALRPQDATPYFGLGMVRLDIGDQPGARAAFATYIRMERDPARGAFVEQARRELSALGSPSSSTTRPAEVQTAAERDDTERHSARTSRGQRDGGSAGLDVGLRAIALLAAEGRHNEALARVQSVHPEAPREQLQLAMWRAYLLTETGHIDEARTVLWGILAAAPTHVAAYRMLETLSPGAVE